MKVLLDSCLWPGARDRIAAAGHEVEWVGAWDADPGDEEILARAFAGRQVIITPRAYSPGWRRPTRNLTLSFSRLGLVFFNDARVRRRLRACRVADRGSLTEFLKPKSLKAMPGATFAIA